MKKAWLIVQAMWWEPNAWSSNFSNYEKTHLLLHSLAQSIDNTGTTLQKNKQEAEYSHLFTSNDQNYRLQKFV